MKSLKVIISDIYNKYRYYIISALIVLAALIGSFIMYEEMMDARHQADIDEDNIEALNDTIKYYKSKSGKQVATILELKTTYKNLKDINEDLYNQIKDMNIKGTVQSGAVIKTEYVEVEKLDTVWKIQNTKKDLSKDFSFINSYRTLTGNVRLMNDTLGIQVSRLSVNMDYTIAQDGDRIYVKTDNPYVTVNEIQGFTIPKERVKRWGAGPMVGYGYNIQGKKLSPFIGIGITYNLLRW